GLRDGGRPENSLQLTRIRDQADAADAAARTLEPGALPPFVRVERTLRVGLTWEVDTRVLRLTPLGSAIALEGPLLAGASGMTAGVGVKDGNGLGTVAPQRGGLEWHSALAEAPALTLRAPQAASWTEVWRLDASPIWHIETEGIPTVHGPADAAIRVREW